MNVSGSHAIIRSLIAEQIDTVFGYPGGANMPLYDALYDYQGKIKHILVRHEQGAAHAAEGYARISGKPGVCFTTSGPGATNLVTGIADAMMDSIPLVCITGQVHAHLLGSDAFQETDVIGITTPITKWNYQITAASEIPEILKKAFFIATHGRPGPVVIDITKNAQVETINFAYPKSTLLPKYKSEGAINKRYISQAALWINNSKRPYVLIGHGVLISRAEKEVRNLMEKGNIPGATTLHGLSAIPYNHPLYMGMLGMHGNLAPNIQTNRADVIVALGMRFDDRVTGLLSRYAPDANIIHVDIDESELNKNVPVQLAIKGDVKQIVSQLLPSIKKVNRSAWIKTFLVEKKREEFAAHKRRLKHSNKIRMNDVVTTISNLTNGNAIIVADVGQNQMFSARYYQFKKPHSFITSGGLGTMGFALPAAIGAKIAAPNREVFAIVGDGGFQMTIQELATIKQEKLAIKIVILNNGYLGMVRQWQQLFFDKRYSFTPISSPNFTILASAYDITSKCINKPNKLSEAVQKMRKHDGPYLLEVKVEAEDNIFPMMEAGSAVDEIRLEE